jgi:hypothetical protein
MDNKDKVISKWLDKRFDKNIDPPRYFLENNYLYDYYRLKDKNLKLNDNIKINELKNFSKYIKNNKPEYNGPNEKIYHKKLILESKLIQTFKNDDGKNYYQYLNPKTPRYHANMLFNKMIDYCIKNEMVDHKDRPLINKSLRNVFYKFCYENSNN